MGPDYNTQEKMETMDTRCIVVYVKMASTSAMGRYFIYDSYSVMGRYLIYDSYCVMGRYFIYDSYSVPIYRFL